MYSHRLIVGSNLGTFYVCLWCGRESSVVSSRGLIILFLFILCQWLPCSEGFIPQSLSPPPPITRGLPLPSPPVSHLSYTSDEGALGGSRRQWRHDSPVFQGTHTQLLECCKGREYISTNGTPGCKQWTTGHSHGSYSHEANRMH